jgi:hypothetical protein
MKKKSKLMVRRTTAYLALSTVVAYIITGYGITQYQIVGRLTFGLLDKTISFKMHSYLIYPLIIFLIIHLYFALSIRYLKKNEKK